MPPETLKHFLQRHVQCVDMKTSFLIKTVLFAASLPLLAGCVERRVVYRDRPVPAGEVVIATPENPPPPPVEVVPVCPDPAYVWVGGYWEWRGRWVWCGGRWAPRPHPGAVWAHGHWARHGHGHVWIGAGWR
jgi:hypothetical protein